ncbi:lemA-like protein [Salinisphaera sp. PC39]|uniref:LemA family protein n=1 Tax=Salinisphaera sp. PC39 TaxID=1304156 RepID=UPI00333E3C39
MSGLVVGFVALALVGGLLGYGILIYNSLVRLKHAVSKAWSNIDVLLKQRHDELPKLVDTCKQYMDYEKETLEAVMRARADAERARTDGDVKGVGRAEGEMRFGLGKLFAVAEAYPDLKANESFRQLQQRISGLEDAIADRREYYNEAVNLNNVRIEQFPDVIVAGLFNFGPADLLEFPREELTDVDVGAAFAG